VRRFSGRSRSRWEAAAFSRRNRGFQPEKTLAVLLEKPGQKRKRTFRQRVLDQALLFHGQICPWSCPAASPACRSHVAPRAGSRLFFSRRKKLIPSLISICVFRENTRNSNVGGGRGKPESLMAVLFSSVVCIKAPFALKPRPIMTVWLQLAKSLDQVIPVAGGVWNARLPGSRKNRPQRSAFSTAAGNHRRSSKVSRALPPVAPVPV